MRTDDDGPSATHHGQTYHFCSRACKRSFQDSPDQFTDVDPVASATAGGNDHH